MIDWDLFHLKRPLVYDSRVRTGRIFIPIYILYVPPIPQQIQISVDQLYSGPAASCCSIIGTHSMYTINIIHEYHKKCQKWEGFKKMNYRSTHSKITTKSPNCFPNKLRARLAVHDNGTVKKTQIPSCL
jgi:hypothetical protein